VDHAFFIFLLKQSENRPVKLSLFFISLQSREVQKGGKLGETLLPWEDERPRRRAVAQPSTNHTRKKPENGVKHSG